MTKKMMLTFFMLLWVAAPCLAGSGHLMKPGKWEITTSMEMPGMPMKMPPVTMTQCLTDENPVPNQSQANQDCQLQNVKTEGHTVSWEIVCQTDGGQMNGKGHMTYDGDRMSGVTTFNMNMPGQGKIQMTNTIKGHRIGPCD